MVRPRGCDCLGRRAGYRRGDLYIADTINNRVRKISTTGIITTVAGNGSSNYSGDGGLATAAGLNLPFGVAVDTAENLYIADSSDYRIRKVAPNGTITSIAGTGRPGYSGDGGPATAASLSALRGVAVGSKGRIYITDGNRVRVLTLSSPTPSIAPAGIVPADSSSSVIQPGEWVSIYGANLASSTSTWTEDFPISLGGTSVKINGKSAYLSLASPGQINLQAPDDPTTGPVPVVVTTASGSTTSTVMLAPYAPFPFLPALTPDTWRGII